MPTICMLLCIVSCNKSDYVLRWPCRKGLYCEYSNGFINILGAALRTRVDPTFRKLYQTKKYGRGFTGIMK